MTASILILCISALALSVGANFCSDKVNGTYSIPDRPCSIQFYYCSNHLLSVFNCPATTNQLYYSAAKGYCDYPWNIHGCSGLTTHSQTVRPPTTVVPTTLAPTTLAETTLAPTTLAPTTLAPTTLAPTTMPPTTQAPTTLAPTTLPPTTRAPTTLVPTTQAPTTTASTTLAPTTLPTVAPTTAAPTTLAAPFCANRGCGYYPVPGQQCSTHYFQCINHQSPISKTCSAGLVFNPATSSCDFARNIAQCNVHPKTGTTTVAPAVVTPTGGHGTCIGKVNGSYALPGNPCSEFFYKCSDGIFSLFHCAAPSVATYWNDVKKECDYAYNIPACSGH